MYGADIGTNRICAFEMWEFIRKKFEFDNGLYLDGVYPQRNSQYYNNGDQILHYQHFLTSDMEHFGDRESICNIIQ